MFYYLKTKPTFSYIPGCTRFLQKHFCLIPQKAIISLCLFLQAPTPLFCFCIVNPPTHPLFISRPLFFFVRYCRRLRSVRIHFQKYFALDRESVRRPTHIDSVVANQKICQKNCAGFPGFAHIAQVCICNNTESFNERAHS